MTTKSIIVREAEIVYRKRELEDESGTIAKRFAGSRDVATILRAWIGSSVAEQFVVIAVNAKNSVQSTHVAGKGCSTFCPVSIPAILRFALLSGAPAFIVGHNHPSGDVTPSHDDVEITRKLRTAFEAVGLKLLDHVIVSQEPDPQSVVAPSYYSFLDSGVVLGSFAT